MVSLAFTSTVCSFVFGWAIQWPFILVVAIGLLYAFSALGDSPVLSAALTEVVSPPYLGAALGLRSLLGFGAGAVSPVVFGIVLDATNPVQAPAGYYSAWGWAFSVLGVAGIGATYAVYRYGHHRRVDRMPV
jgi:MFS family permease